MSKRVVYRNMPKPFADKEDGDSPFIDLKVTEAEKERKIKIKLVGTAINFIQYSPYKQKTKEQKTKEQTTDEPYPFPDAHLNTKRNRYGDVDDQNCPWKKGGWQKQLLFATNCLQLTIDADGNKVWVPKILSKGNSIFSEFSKWELGRIQEIEDTGDDNLTSFLGGKSSPIITITATYHPKKMGKVEYQVFMSSSDIEINGDMIESLRSIGEPTPENLEKAKKEFKEGYPDQKWYDFYAYGYPLEVFFKPTPMLTEQNAEIIDDEEEIDLEDLEEEEEEEPINKKASKKVVVDEEEEDDDEEEKPASKPSKKASKKSADDDEDDDLDINW